MELVNLVNSVLFFLSQMTLFRWLTFLLGFLTVTLTVLLYWISFFLLTLVIVLQWLSLHWKLLMLLSQFPSSPRQTQKGMPRFIVLFVTILLLIGMVFVIIWDVPWDIFKLGAFAASSKFCDWFQESMYISFIVNIRLSFTHPHGFQLLLLLPLLLP